MTHEQFCYFIEGVMITRRDLPPTREEWQIIRDRLIDTLHPELPSSPKATERTAEDYSRTVQLSHEDVFGPSIDSKRLDECEQGEVKKPIIHRTIRDVIAECDQAKISKITSPTIIPRYVQPFTPQAPFSGEAY